MWLKLGRVFDPEVVKGIPWLDAFAQAPATLVFDDFVRVYFSCRPAPDAGGQYVSYSAYVDVNRHDLRDVLRIAERPVLALGDRGTFDEFGTYPISVIRHSGKVLAYYGGWTRCESVPFNVAIGLAVSEDDGRTFNKVGPGPVLSYTPDEPFVISGPKVRRFNDIFYLFYIAGTEWLPTQGIAEPVYRIRMATSLDGIRWKKHGQDLIPPRIEEREAQASPDVFYSGDRYHMFFSYRHSIGYRGRERGYRIGYAHSRDLVDWKRDDSRAGIEVSEDGWDSEMISYPHLLGLDGNTYMFYLGNQVGKSGFGLAQLQGEL